MKSNGGPIDTERDIVWREQYAISGMNTMGMGIFYEAMRRWVRFSRFVSFYESGRPQSAISLTAWDRRR